MSGAYLAGIWRTHRDVPVAAHVRAILDAVDPELPPRLSRGVLAELVDAYSRPALLVPPAVADGAREALTTLAARGYTLAVVSNTMRTPGTTLRELLARYRLLDCFTHATFSDEVGVRKPDPRIFELTLAAVAGGPATALHVGDDPVLDVEGARRAGMRVIQVASAPAPAGRPQPDALILGLGALPAAVSRLERGEGGGPSR